MKVILVLFIVLITGCSTDFANKIKAVDKTVVTSEAYDRITYVGLEPTDLMILNHARNRYLNIREKWKDVILDGSFIHQDISEDYNLLVRQYNTVVGIINKNYSKYSKEDMDYFNKISMDFLELDETLDNFYEVKNAVKVLKDMIYVAGALLLK